MQEMEGTIVLVTGASRGLGAALARAFAHAGAALGLCARSEAALEAVAAEVRALGAACVARAADVRDPAALDAWVAAVERELGPPDVLINNASVLGPRVPLAEHDPAEWRATLDVNLNGAFLAMRAVLPSMLRRGAGSIINVSSGAAALPRVDWGAYSVSKHALDGLSRNLAEELRGTGVRVNSVDPGSMRTEMRAAAYPEEEPESVRPPDKATGVFIWLASPAARGVTGKRFRAADWRPA